MDTPRIEASSVPVRSVRKGYFGWVVFAVTSVVSLLILLGALYFASGDKLGTLQVSTNLPDDQFEIFLDDVFVANSSPYLRTDLKPGAYRLEVRPKVGSAKSYEVEVVAGSPAFVSADFEAATATRGTIEITSEPAGASVLLNGAEIGVTPLTLRDQTTTTSVAVLVRRDGYEPMALNVAFTPGSTVAKAHCQLKALRDSGSSQAPTPTPTRSQVTIQTSPAGAAIYIDGDRRGEAPLTITDLFPGRMYVVQARKSGFKTTQKMFKVEAKGATAVELQLDEAAGGDASPTEGGTKTLATKQNGNPTPTKQAPNPTPTKVAPSAGGKTSCSNVDDAIVAANYTGEANCEVFVNNRRIGAVPMFREAAPSGRCEVRFQCPSGKVLKKVIELKPKVHTRILVENNELVAR